MVELRYTGEHAVLETYGELINASFFKKDSGDEANILHHLDNNIAEIVKSVLKEAGIKAREAIYAVPAGSSFVTTMSFPAVSVSELENAIPFEARKYVPIPISEVVIDWDILQSNETDKTSLVLLVAVAKSIVEKFKHVAELSGLHLKALEVESFSITRSLGATDPAPTAFINLGHQSTTLAISEKGKLYVSHSFSRGSGELTRAIERGLSVSYERAESLKRETGISEKIEEREITSIMTPFIDALFNEIERIVALYNRKAPRSIQKVNLTGGGANLKGLVEYTASKFNVEVTKGNPFARVVTPSFMQPVLREIGPSFAVAVGLALHGFKTK